jgi:hypothetical protein
MRKSTRILGAVAVAGLIAAGSAAFTGSGILQSGTAAPTSGFAGGTVSQTVTGANLSDIDYIPLPGPDSLGKITDVALTFDSDIPGDQGVSVTVNALGVVMPCVDSGNQRLFTCVLNALGVVVADLHVTVEPA